MGVAETMRIKLSEALAPVALEVEDESERHRGHAGWRPGGETHFRIKVVSAAFEGRSRVDRQRMVYELLKEEMAGRVHALALETRTPGETEAG